MKHSIREFAQETKATCFAMCIPNVPDKSSYKKKKQLKNNLTVKSVGLVFASDAVQPLPPEEQKLRGGFCSKRVDKPVPLNHSVSLTLFSCLIPKEYSLNGRVNCN